MKIINLLIALFLGFFGPIGTAAAQSSSEAEMRELFRSVEKRLKAIDELLSDASAGEATSNLAKARESGIDEILKLSRQESQGVIEAIDRILEISASQPQPGQGSGSGSPQPSQSLGQQEGSPLDRGQQTTPRESTPEMPGQELGQQSGQRPDEQTGEETPGGKDGEKPQDASADPKSGKVIDESNPENLQLGEGQTGPPGAPSSADGVERWGALPKHAQEVFRSEGGTELPARYREWIDAYHRRLNRESRGR